MVQWFSGNSGENEKRGIPLKVFPFFRKIFCGKTCSIWFPTGKTDFSIQIESAHDVPFELELHNYSTHVYIADLKNKKASLETSVQRAQRDVEKLAEPQVAPKSPVLKYRLY